MLFVSNRVEQKGVKSVSDWVIQDICQSRSKLLMAAEWPKYCLKQVRLRFSISILLHLLHLVAEKTYLVMWEKFHLHMQVVKLVLGTTTALFTTGT